eukprot:gene112-9728_t
MDEATDKANKEQCVFCIRYVDDELHGDFVGLYEIELIKSDVLVKFIEYVMCRLNLPFSKVRGQCYDGASALSGAKMIFFTCYAHRQENNYAAELESIKERAPEDAREELPMNHLDDDLVERNMVEDSDGELEEEEADDDEIEDDRDPVIGIFWKQAAKVVKKAAKTKKKEKGGSKETTGGAEHTKGKRPSTKQKHEKGLPTGGGFLPVEDTQDAVDIHAGVDIQQGADIHDAGGAILVAVAVPAVAVLADAVLADAVHADAVLADAVLAEGVRQSIKMTLQVV